MSNPLSETSLGVGMEMRLMKQRRLMKDWYLADLVMKSGGRTRICKIVVVIAMKLIDR